MALAAASVATSAMPSPASILALNNTNPASATAAIPASPAAAARIAAAATASGTPRDSPRPPLPPPPHRSAGEALAIHAASCTSPVALLLLGGNAGTTLPPGAQPSLRLPNPGEPTFTPRDRERRSARASTSGPLHPLYRSPGVGSISANGRPGRTSNPVLARSSLSAASAPVLGPRLSAASTATTGAAAVRGAAAGGGGGGAGDAAARLPFSAVWVNHSAREQLLLGSGDEYDSVLTQMCKRDPGLRVLLKELGRQLAAEQAGGGSGGGRGGGAGGPGLPPPVMHFVPGGLFAVRARPSPHSQQQQQQQQQPSEQRRNSATYAGPNSVSGAALSYGGFSVLRLTPCLLRLPVEPSHTPCGAGAAGTAPAVARRRASVISVSAGAGGAASVSASASASISLPVSRAGSATFNGCQLPSSTVPSGSLTAAVVAVAATAGPVSAPPLGALPSGGHISANRVAAPFGVGLTAGRQRFAPVLPSVPSVEPGAADSLNPGFNISHVDGEAVAQLLRVQEGAVAAAVEAAAGPTLTVVTASVAAARPPDLRVGDTASSVGVDMGVTAAVAAAGRAGEGNGDDTDGGAAGGDGTEWEEYSALLVEHVSAEVAGGGARLGSSSVPGQLGGPPPWPQQPQQGACLIPELYERLQRDCSILSGVASVITLFDLSGDVLHQNAHSVDYMGYHRPQQQPAPAATGSPLTPPVCSSPAWGQYMGTGGSRGPSALTHLFQLDPAKLSEMKAIVGEGKPWTGIVRVPPNLLEAPECGDYDDVDGEEEEQGGDAFRREARSGRLGQLGEGGEGEEGEAPDDEKWRQRESANEVALRGLLEGAGPSAVEAGAAVLPRTDSLGSAGSGGSGSDTRQRLRMGPAPSTGNGHAASLHPHSLPLQLQSGHHLQEPQPLRKPSSPFATSSQLTAAKGFFGVTEPAPHMGGNSCSALLGPALTDSLVNGDDALELAAGVVSADDVDSETGDRIAFAFERSSAPAIRPHRPGMTSQEGAAPSGQVGGDGGDGGGGSGRGLPSGSTTGRPYRPRMSMGGGGGGGGGVSAPLHRRQAAGSEAGVGLGAWHTPDRNRSVKGGLDLQAMNTSAWALVGNGSNSQPSSARNHGAAGQRTSGGSRSSAAGSGFGTFASGGGMPAGCTSMTGGGGGGGGPSSNDYLSKQATARALQSGTDGRSTPLPRVVVFAAASVQRNTVRQQRRQEQLLQQQQAKGRKLLPTNSAPSEEQQQQQQQAQAGAAAAATQDAGMGKASSMPEASTPLSPVAADAPPRSLTLQQQKQPTQQGKEHEVPDVAASEPFPACDGSAADGDASAAPLAAAAFALDLPPPGGNMSAATAAAATATADATSAEGNGDVGPGADPAAGAAAAVNVEIDAGGGGGGGGVHDCRTSPREPLTRAGRIVQEPLTIRTPSQLGRTGQLAAGGVGTEEGAADDEAEEEGHRLGVLEEEEEEEEEGARWHEVTARPFRDPVSRRRCILLTQVDVTAKVETERRLAELVDAEHKILEQIFPRHVLEHMALDTGGCAFHMFRRTDCSRLATKHAAVSILFADIRGFTNMCKEVEAEVVMTFLNDLYNRLDTLLDVYGVYKVETIGDCYMVAGGLIRRDDDGFTSVQESGAVDPLHAVRVMSFAKAMLREASRMRMPRTGEPLLMRVGIHSGPVMSGVVGMRMPRFCLFGDTVNTASRMESTGSPGLIHVSEDTQRLLTNEVWEPRGGVEVKGKGLMQTFIWLGNDKETAQHLITGSDAAAGGRGERRAGLQPKRSSTAPRGEAPPPPTPQRSSTAPRADALVMQTPQQRRSIALRGASRLSRVNAARVNEGGGGSKSGSALLGGLPKAKSRRVGGSAAEAVGRAVMEAEAAMMRPPLAK